MTHTENDKTGRRGRWGGLRCSDDRNWKYYIRSFFRIFIENRICVWMSVSVLTCVSGHIHTHVVGRPTGEVLSFRTSPERRGRGYLKCILAGRPLWVPHKIHFFRKNTRLCWGRNMTGSVKEEKWQLDLDSWDILQGMILGYFSANFTFKHGHKVSLHRAREKQIRGNQGKEAIDLGAL